MRAADWTPNYAPAQVSHPNNDGETFKPGDKVAKLPDTPSAWKLHGVVKAVLYRGFHVLVEWQDYALLDAHVDRITHAK